MNAVQAASPGEVTLFSDANALVSTTRIILKKTTYPLSNVSSVRMLTINPPQLVTVLVTVTALFTLAAQSWAIGLVVLAVAAFLAFARKSQYALLVGSAGGEKSALTSKSARYIQSLVDVINEAVISRG